MLVPWAVSTLRAIFLKVQVHRSGHWLTAAQRVPPTRAHILNPICCERCVSLKIKKAHRPLIHSQAQLSPFIPASEKVPLLYGTLLSPQLLKS